MPIGGQVFKGRQGQYSVTALRPTAFGRSSVIWSAVSATGEEFIVKLMRGTPSSAKQWNALSEFELETETHSKLSHPNILPILDWGVDSEGLQPAPFLVLPPCKYGDLRQAIGGQRFIPFERAIRILQPLAAAIDYAHSCGILHGDIKPENVLFWQSRDHACLADFGASRYYPQSLAISGQGAIGTADYLSPEELDGGRATPASDLYSFALVAYEILTGDLPFDHSVAFHSMQARLHGELSSALAKNPLLPVRVNPAFLAAFALAPEKRPRSAAMFVQSLLTEPLADSSPIVVKPVDEGRQQAAKADDLGQQTSNGKPGSRFAPDQRVELWKIIVSAIVAILTALITMYTAIVLRHPQSSQTSPAQPTVRSSPPRDNP
jgi:serine/threonine-protein kinase